MIWIKVVVRVGVGVGVPVPLVAAVAVVVVVVVVVVVNLKAWNFINKRLQHMHFSMNIAKFLRTAFL